MEDELNDDLESAIADDAQALNSSRRAWFSPVSPQRARDTEAENEELGSPVFDLEE